MQEINSLNAETILEEEVFQEILNDEDSIHQAQLLLTLIDKAKELGVKTKFETLYKAHKKEHTKQQKEKQLPESQDYSRTTDFSGRYDQLQCGSWIANDNGIRIIDNYGVEAIVCHHPILPIQRLISVDTNKEKIKLAYKDRETWNEIIVEKRTIADVSKIISLSENSIDVNSNNSKALMKYLTDVINMNIDSIDTKSSTSKLGWIKDEFIPYSQDYEFDGEQKFKDVYESIEEVGNEEKWMELARDIRKSSRFEPKIAMISSLASVLIEPLNALPFILNLWTDTGKGKTVTSMLATSIWANPAENAYMTDAKSTVTALELRLDVLNNLPMFIDDMSQVKNKYDGDFSELVYMLCSGKGKDRANQALGLNKSTTWKNAIITNYEHSMITETMQGGAVNRVIDVECEEGNIFEDGHGVVEIITQNYGFAGRKFVDVIGQIGMDKVREIQKKAYNSILERAKQLGVEKEEKQILPMSIILTADIIATGHIFEDGQYLKLEQCVDLLKNKGEVSENERAYEYIMSEISININKFKPDDHGNYKGEIWGALENGYAIIYKNVFDRIMCEKGNFSGKSFLSWANKKGLLDTAKGRNTKQKRLQNSLSWCVYLKLPEDYNDGQKNELESDNDGFVKVPEEMQEELPFV